MPYYKIVELVEKLSSAYSKIQKTWIQIWIQVFNMKNLIFDYFRKHLILHLTIDLRVLGHGEQFCVLDFLAEMPVFCSLQKNENIMKSIKSFSLG